MERVQRKKRGIIDIHCHVLHGVDDGAKTLEDALDMIDIAYHNGTRGMILTPHHHGGRYISSKEKLVKQYKELTTYVKKEYPDMRLYMGNEVYFQMDTMDVMGQGKISTLAKSDYVLVEFATSVMFQEMKTAFQDLQMGGYLPIIAHVERYDCLQRNIDLVQELIEQGIYIQVNASSVLGKHGLRTKMFLHKLISQEKVHFVASDSHSTRSRNPNLKEVYLHLKKKYGSSVANDLLILNPERIIANEYI